MAAFVVLFLALGLTGALYATITSGSRAAADSSTSSSSVIDQGKRLFISSCSSCHGKNAEGTGMGPSLIGVGSAAVDFQVGTGRMPAQQPGPQIVRKANTFSQQDIDAIAAWIASLGGGPQVPTSDQVDASGLTPAQISNGGVLFRMQCADCHNFAGEGGALTNGKFAPDLKETTPTHLYEAMLTGPQNMPVFNDRVLPPEQKKEIIGFVTAVRTDPNQGGFALGKLGPVSEGLFIWVFGLGALIICAVWIGGHTRKAPGAKLAVHSTRDASSGKGHDA